jgi:WD40 repeat protein
MLHLTVERDGQPPQERDFAGSTIVVGREDKLDLQLAHEDGASRQHCRLTVEGRQVFVEDLGSSNGTKVNGHRIDRRLAVKVGDIVTVGKVRLRIGAVSDGPAARRAAEPAPARAAKAIVVNQPAARKPAAAEPAPAPKKTKPAPEPEPAPAKASKPAKAAAKPASRVVVHAPEPEPEPEPEPAAAPRDPKAPRDANTNDENEACRSELDPLARRWRDLNRPAWGLLYGEQLARGLRWMQSDRKLKPRPSEHHREYIIASRRDRRDRVRRLVGGIGAVTLAALAGSLTAHAVHRDIVIGNQEGNEVGGAAQLCTGNPPSLQRSNQLAAMATAQPNPELALLIAARALAAAEGPCARHGQAEEVLRAQLARQRSRILGHQDVAFRDVDIARDDEMAVTVDDAGGVKLYVMGGDGTPQSLTAPSGKATLAALSPSDSTLAIGTASGGVDLYNVAQRSKPTLIKQLDAHSDEISALAYSDDGRWLATADKRGVIRTWDMRGSAAGDLLGELREHRSPVTKLIFRDGGQRLYSLGGQAFAWDLADGRRKNKPLRLAMPGDVTAIAVDTIGTEVFTADQFGEVLRWKIRGGGKGTFERIAKLEGPVVALAFMNNDRALISVGTDRQLLVTEVDKKMREDSTPLSLGLQGLPGVPQLLALDPAGRHAAVAAADGKIYLWDLSQRLTSAQPTAVLDEHGDTIRDLVTTRDGNWLISAGNDGTLRRWDLQHTGSGAGSYAANDHEGPVFELALSGDGARMLSGGQDKQLRAWRIDPAGDPRLQFLRPVDAPIKALALSSDGRWAAVGVDRQLRIFDLTAIAGDANAPPLERSHHNEVVRHIAFSANREWMVSADDAGVVNSWRMRGDGPEETPTRSEATASAVTALALAPTEPLVAVGGYDKAVRIWPLGGAAGAPVQKVAPHDAAVLSLVFSGNSQYLLSGGEDSRALLRRSLDGRFDADPEHASFTHERPIRGLAFSPDRRWMATGSDDGLIRVWNMEKEKSRQKDLTGHEGPIIALAFDASNELLVSAGQDKTLRLWRVGDLDLGGDVASMVLKGHSGAITSLRLDHAGRFAVSAGDDGAVHVWPLQHDLLLRLACRVVGRDFSDAEWATLFPGEPQEAVCGQR